eukprot:6709953-Pyramimonas_sp.AAC.1
MCVAFFLCRTRCGLRPQDGPNTAQESPKRGPGRPQDGPKSAPREAQEGPNAPLLSTRGGRSDLRPLPSWSDGLQHGSPDRPEEPPKASATHKKDPTIAPTRP